MQLFPDGASAPWPDGAVCALQASVVSPRNARDFTEKTLRGWGLPGLTDDAAIVVSELVTNALRHGIGTRCPAAGDRPIRLSLVRHQTFVVCIVADPGDGHPSIRTPGDACEGGRGLHVIEALSRAWGWTPLPGTGKAVWAALPIS